jgi:phosphatidylserine/phosphatidylglycerophosphate/cardiolipin synthase-like enzyme
LRPTLAPAEARATGRGGGGARARLRERRISPCALFQFIDQRRRQRFVCSWPTPILQAVFATMWPNTTGENFFEERYSPQVTAGVQGTPIQVVNAGPDSRWEAIRQSYLAMIALACHHIYLQSPFLILDTSVAEAMKTAALAGLDVRVMIAPSGAEWSPA